MIFCQRPDATVVAGFNKWKYSVALTSREIAEVEVEVESVVYIVCDVLGVDTSDYSFSYVARWAEGSTELVKDTAERVVACAKQILDGLEADPRGGMTLNAGKS